MLGVDDVGLGRTLRALRLRARLTQATAAERARISQSAWSRIERGHLESVALGVLRRTFAAVDARLEASVAWRGGAIDRLRDQGHSDLVAATVIWLQRMGWEAAVEVTYSEFGERGSIDILAVQAGSGLALIVEVKTTIESQEQMIRRLDEKSRLAPKIVFERFGWRPTAVSRLLVLGSSMTNRRRVTALAPILDGAFPLRSDAARAWLRTPSGRGSALVFVSASHPRTRGDASKPIPGSASPPAHH